MEAFGPLKDLHGAALFGLIAGMLLLEELGAPLPVPGDLVIAFGGVAAAAGAGPWYLLIFAGVIGLALGSMAAREIFSRLGRPLVLRIASRLHSTRALERATTAMQHGRWEAILVARLIPGLRVPVSAAAGISGVTREDFAIGTSAAATVYGGLLFGIGYAAGRPFIQFMRAAEHAGFSFLGWVAAAAALGVLLWLLHRFQLWPGVPSYLPPREV
jgi:membrane protein DedA with SNARE-associated domain